jgi:hypothetical protein
MDPRAKVLTILSYAADSRPLQALRGRWRGRFRYFLDGNVLGRYAAQVASEVSKNNRRRVWLVACVGVILGFGGACLKGPTLVSWLFKPLQDSFSCSGSVNEALTQFVELQFGCAILGGVLALVGLFFWRRFFRRRAEARQSRSAS